MKSSYLTNLLLIFLVIGLYWFNNQSPTTEGDTPPLTTLSTNDIQQITIERIHLDNIILEKRSADWLLLQPFNARANNIRIKLLLSLLSMPSHAQLAYSDDELLTQLGLSPAKVTLKLNEYLFQFGNVETISNRRYVLYDGTIHLIDDQISHLLNASASSFIENRLIKPNNVINKITLPILDSTNTLSNEYADAEYLTGQWSHPEYSADQLTTLISVWQHAYALQVSPIKKKDFSNSHQVTIWYKNIEEPTELKILLTDKILFIYDQQRQLKYQFPMALAQQLFPHDNTTP